VQIKKNIHFDTAPALAGKIMQILSPPALHATFKKYKVKQSGKTNI
jgi:hypothetical protein